MYYNYNKKIFVLSVETFHETSPQYSSCKNTRLVFYHRYPQINTDDI